MKQNRISIRFRRITSVLLCLISACLCLSACGNTTGENGEEIPAGYVPVEAETAEYTMYVPKDWQIDTTNGITSVWMDDDAKSSVSVACNSLSGSFTVPEYWDEYKSYFSETFSDIKMEEEASDTTLGGVAAKKYIYTAKVGDTSYRWMQILAIRSANVYIFTYTSTVDSYESNMENVTTVLDYFRFN